MGNISTSTNLKKKQENAKDPPLRRKSSTLYKFKNFLYIFWFPNKITLYPQLLSQGRRVRILATGYYDDSTTELLNNFRTKYLVNMKNIEVMGLEELCRDLNIEHNYSTPRDTINRVITSLSDKYRDSDIVTLLLVDEVFPCEYNQTTPDWRDLVVRENVIWLLGLSPRASSYATSTEVLPPVNSSVLTWPLIHKHRNCPQIRKFIKTINTKLYLFEIFI